MLEFFQTDVDGYKATEICFHTGRDTGGEAYIEIPLGRSLVHGNVIDPVVMNKKKNFMECDAIAQIMDFCNITLREIYASHKGIKSSSAQPFSREHKVKYHVGIHTAINMLYKTLFFIALLWKEDFLPGNSKNMLSLRDFTDEIRTKMPVPISQNALELCDIIDHINHLFQSENMFYGFNMFGDSFPTVLAAGPWRENELIVHNHALAQLVVGFNDFIKEIEFFAEDAK